MATDIRDVQHRFRLGRITKSDDVPDPLSFQIRKVEHRTGQRRRKKSGHEVAKLKMPIQKLHKGKDEIIRRSVTITGPFLTQEIGRINHTAIVNLR